MVVASLAVTRQCLAPQTMHDQHCCCRLLRHTNDSQRSLSNVDEAYAYTSLRRAFGPIVASHWEATLFDFLLCIFLNDKWYIIVINSFQTKEFNRSINLNCIRSHDLVMIVVVSNNCTAVELSEHFIIKLRWPFYV